MWNYTRLDPAIFSISEKVRNPIRLPNKVMLEFIGLHGQKLFGTEALNNEGN